MATFGNSSVGLSFVSVTLRRVRILATVLAVVGTAVFVQAVGASAPGLAVEAAASVRAAESYDGPLSFEERVRYQRRIEQVYWQHRIWPAGNPGPKPALDDVVPDAVIRDRVATYLEKSAALELLWSRPLTGEQLQAEVNRMVRDTKNPGLLRELIAVLDHDPLLVAECLARPILVDRLTGNWYAYDARFHGALREQVEAALLAQRGVAAKMAELGGEYAETEIRLVAEEHQAADLDRETAELPAVELTEEEWRERIRHLAKSFAIEHESKDSHPISALLEEIPLGRLSRPVEKNELFVVTALLSRTQHRLKIATVTWAKRPFDNWWAEEGLSVVQSPDRINPIPPPSGGYELISPTEDGCAEDTWTEFWNQPTARSFHTAVWTGAEMIVWGGNDPDGFVNTGGRYDPATDRWTATSTGTGVPTPRYLHAAVWTGVEMIVWGGKDTGGFVNTGGRYDPVTDGWTATSTGTDVPTPRIGHTAVWTGTEMLVWGGSYYDGGSVPLNTGGRYDPSSNSWEGTSTGFGTPSGRLSHTAVWTGTEMIVWGGYKRGDEFTNTGGGYDPSTNSWTATPTGAGVPTARGDHGAVWTGTEMVVFGGQDGPNTTDLANTGGRYDPSANSWTATSTGAGVPAARVYHTTVWTGNEMIVWGGNGVYNLEHTGAWYDPLSDSWTATSTTGTGVPESRRNSSAVWTGAEMIVWGGYNDALLNTGGRYDPATDSWTATSTGADVPAARWYHTTVWTGTEMIVWGGTEAGFMNTGGRYDPSTDSWTATSTGAGVPTARRDPGSVWTGTEMIVWGGYNGVDLNTGGRYDPRTDGWTATSTGAGVPVARWDHTTVWTGTEMIVWGGFLDYFYPTNTGGRYDPRTDSWTATSMETGVPTRRLGHAAVWTGTKMIVWGGVDDSGFTDTGGLYEPLTDTWTATSIGAGSPPGREYFSALWTGTEMIVWGGKRYNDYYNSGGRYDPLMDAWTLTSTGTGVPIGRAYHAAVWTGAEMLVWSGQTYQAMLNDGGSYCACEGGAVSTWYPDADGDGHGADSTGVRNCSQPPGHVAAGDDCNDTNPDIHAGAPEVNDGLDNQCPGENGYGLIDELTGSCGFHDPGDKDEFSWPAQSGAVGYLVARSADPQFATDCTEIYTEVTQWVDTDPVPTGGCHYYLVRPSLPNSGSWGESSAGDERTGACL